MLYPVDRNKSVCHVRNYPYPLKLCLTGLLNMKRLRMNELWKYILYD